MAMSSDSDFETPVMKVKFAEGSTQKEVPSSESLAKEITAVSSVGPKRTYLITYSHADKELFPTRKDFAVACHDAFNGKDYVSYYACCEEEHEDGTPHYHVTIQLKKPCRWGPAKRRLAQKGATVNFSEGPCNSDGKYAWIYRYITKLDQDVYHSKTHPTLDSIKKTYSRTSVATNAQKKRGQSTSSHSGSQSTSAPRPPKRAKKLTNEDVSNYCREKDIKTLDELMADGETRRVNGDSTLSSFLLNRSLKSVTELIDVTWRMARAVTKVRNLSIPRMDALRTASQSPCVPQCAGMWLKSALEILHFNDINKYAYADRMRDALQHGRGKDRNIFIMGPGNTGKTFLLKPLRLIYPESFVNPSSSHFSWDGVDQSTLIFLNDYRWHVRSKGGNITWNELLNLLEGFKCELPAPRNHRSKDICITPENDLPIFATGPVMLKWYSVHEEEPRGEKHASEDYQIALRWKVFKLTHQFVGSKDIPECPSCFAKLAFTGADD